MPDKNPLLRNDGLPEFNNVTIENCIAAIGKQSAQFENGIRSIEETVRVSDGKVDVFNSVLNSLEQLATPLDTTWGLAKTLYLGNQSLMPTKCYMTIHDRARMARASKFNSLPIYGLFKQEYGGKKKHMEEHKRVLKKYVTEGRLNGLDLDEFKKAKLTQVVNKITSECTKYKGKVDAATKVFSHTINDSKAVRDYPEKLLKLLAVDEKNVLKGPWKVTLHPQLANPFLEYCPDGELRWNVWAATTRRASGYTDKTLENSTHLEEIRYLRREQAQLLGFKNFVHMSMETKMAGSIEYIKEIFEKLLNKAVIAQEYELEALNAFATERGFDGSLNLWDIPYWKRKQRKTLFDYDEERLKEYFPLPKVLGGLFDLSERLFNITIKERSEIKAWHKDVRFFDIFEPHTSAPIAGFYLDLYSRKDEKLRTQENSGWMVSIRNHSFVTETKPLSSLIFNFQPPMTDKPSLLNFHEVKLLFHKFGFALQHLLTRTKYSDVAGLSNVEWDAVEVCGHVLSNWLYDTKTLQSITGHYENDEPLSREMADNIKKLRQHMAGYDLCNEIYRSNLDLEIYSSKDFWLDIVKRLWPKHILLPFDKEDSHPCSFTEIFSGEWAAAYYSQIWSQMIAADIYGAFHEAQGDEKQLLEVGKRFRETYLSLGGSCHPSEVFRRFRGRDPSHKALLASLGLKQVRMVDNKNKAMAV